MGRAAKRRQLKLVQLSGTQRDNSPLQKSRPSANRASTQVSKEQICSIVESLLSEPKFATIVKKIQQLPALNYKLSEDARHLLRAFECAVAAKILDKDSPDEQEQEILFDLPALAVKNAVMLHIINSMAAGDTVSTIISKLMLQHGIELACYNRTLGDLRVKSSDMPTLTIGS